MKIQKKKFHKNNQFYKTKNSKMNFREENFLRMRLKNIAKSLIKINNNN